MTSRGDDRGERLRLLLDDLAVESMAVQAELVATRALRANGGDDDEHDPDGVPLSSVLQQLEGQRVRLIGQSREVADSLVALAQGRYGICENCSRPIDPARLAVRPTARTCVSCAR